MKKLFALLMALVFACTFLTAVCETATPLRIVCTTFPQYDWTHQLLGDRADDVELTLLLDNGIDLHNYQPTADDIIKIARSDLFIYVGGESDAWVNDLLETSQNSRVKALSMLACVDAKEEESVEGMQEDAHECGHAHHEAEYDEHVWLSLRNAETITRAILEALCEADPRMRRRTAPTRTHISPSLPIWTRSTPTWCGMPRAPQFCSPTASRSAIWPTITA